MSVAILIGIVGCATGPQFQAALPPPPDAARVYVYRLKHYNPWAGLVPNATPYRITMSDGRVVDLSNGGYYSFLARSGINTLGSSIKYSPSWFVAMMLEKKELLRTEFTGGETYYLKFEVGAFGSQMKVVERAVGEEEIRKCKLVTQVD